MDFWCFLAIFELMSDSLTTTQVEPKQCPSHQSILLIQGQIHKNFMKKYWELAELEYVFFFFFFFWQTFSVFKVGHFDFFFASSQGKKQPVYMRYHFFLHYGWFFQNLGKEAVRTLMHTTVCSLDLLSSVNFRMSFWFLKFSKKPTKNLTNF